MIDPTNITKFDRTEAELEEFLLFCVLVAGKNSKVQAKKLEDFIETKLSKLHSPFERINRMIYSDFLIFVMKEIKLGQYSRLSKCFTELMALKGTLSTCTVADLEAISGIGRKTSRFFLTHSRPNQNFAVLDTHILKWLNTHGVPAPKSTPSSDKLYQHLSDKWMELSSIHYPTLTPSERDLLVWKEYSQKKASSQ